MDLTDAPPPWLLLVHQLPTSPSRVRVKIWRRLNSVGAVSIKNSVYVLPNSRESREDFEWIQGEIVAGGGEAIVFAAYATDELGTSELRDRIERARREDWESLFQKCQEILESHGDAPVSSESRADARRRLGSLREEAAQLEKIDHFGSPARQTVIEALERLESRIDPRCGPEHRGDPRRDRGDYQGRTWLTRPRPGVDRMASAWLIRTFIDPAARFRFGERIPRGEDVVPFDMFGVDLGHRGERVTFEVLLDDFGLSDPGLVRLGRIVHDLDLRVQPYAPEAVTVGRLVDGLRATCTDDQELLEHGIVVFASLYASFRSETGEDAHDPS